MSFYLSLSYAFRIKIFNFQTTKYELLARVFLDGVHFMISVGPTFYHYVRLNSASAQKQMYRIISCK